MAVKRTTFTITVDANGVAETDAHLSGIPTTGARHAFLECVTFDDSAAQRQAKGLFLYQVEADSDGNSQAGTLVFQADRPDINVPMYPRIAAVNDQGVALSGAFGRLLLRASSFRVKVTGSLVAGDVYTVVVYWETAGDYRF